MVVRKSLYTNTYANAHKHTQETMKKSSYDKNKEQTKEERERGA